MKRPQKRRGEPARINKTLTALVRKLGRGQRGIHPEIWARWGEIVGGELAKRVFPRRLKAGVLVVVVSSSPWMQELSFVKGALLEKIAGEVGPDVVRDIRFILDTSLADPSGAAAVPAKSTPSPTRECSPAVDQAVESIDDDVLRSVVRRAVQANLKP